MCSSGSGQHGGSERRPRVTALSYSRRSRNRCAPTAVKIRAALTVEDSATALKVGADSRDTAAWCSTRGAAWIVQSFGVRRPCQSQHADP